MPYIDRDKVFNKADILTVHTREYGSIEAIPVEYLADLPIEDVVPRSEVEKLQAEIKDFEISSADARARLKDILWSNFKLAKENKELKDKLEQAEQEVADKIVNTIADLMWQGESEKLNILIGGVYCKKQEFIDKIKKYTGENK